MEQLVQRIDEFITACGDVKPPSEEEKLKCPPPRGGFAQVRFSYNHCMGAGNQAGEAIFIWYLQV